MMMMIPTSAAGEDETGRGRGRGAVSLHFDAMMEILLRLPVKTLARFRCVCKPWCSLTYDPYFIKKHHRMASSTASTFFTSMGPLAFYDFGSGQITERPLPPPTEDPLRDPMFSYPLDGLVCGFRSDTVFLRNLSTGEVALLPSPTCKAAVANVGLGFDPSSGNYKLLRVSYPAGSPKSCVCEALTVSANQEWRYLGKSPTLSLYRELFYFNGFIHWIDRSDELAGTPVVVVAFDCKDETFSTLPVPESARFQQAELVGVDGRLCFAGMHNRHLNIVMLEDYARPAWTTLYVINCAVVSDVLTDLRIVGVQNGNVLLFDSWNLEGSFVVYFYDLRSKVWSKMTYRETSLYLCLYTESLVSPKRLLNPQGE